MDLGWLRDVGWWRVVFTSDFIGAFGPHPLVVEFSDLAFLAGGEWEWISRGVEVAAGGGDSRFARRSHYRICCHVIMYRSKG